MIMVMPGYLEHSHTADDCLFTDLVSEIRKNNILSYRLSLISLKSGNKKCLYGNSSAKSLTFIN